MLHFIGSALMASVILSSAMYTTVESNVDRFKVTTFKPVQEYEMTIFSIPPDGNGEVSAEEYISPYGDVSIEKELTPEETEATEAEDAEAEAEETESALQADDSEIVFKRGDMGAEIRKLQHRLADVGYMIPIVDGDYGNQTSAAVMQFQEDNGFEVTGDLTKMQYDLLFPEEAETATATENPDATEAGEQENALVGEEDTESPEDTGAEESAVEYEKDNSDIVAEPGDKGALVYKIQQKLALIHYPCISDGDYGNSTAEAVKKFQTDNGYEPTGKLTQKQYDLLFPEDAETSVQAAEESASAAETESDDATSAYSLTESGDMIVSQYGDKGALVYKIQQRLVSLGYLGSAVDGDFGDLTLNAVKRFQEDNGYEATGRLTDAQYELLFPGESAAAAVESEKPIESYVTENKT